MSKNILLTGGSGLVGKELTTMLLKRGYTVSHLSRKPAGLPGVKTFVWDIGKGLIDEQCIEGVDTIVHLAGAGVAEKRWTDSRKQEIVDSRVKSIRLLYNLLERKTNRVKAVISASGTGYYGNRADELLTEQSTPGDDFLAKCCLAWEAAVDEGAALGLRVVKFRTGMVLSTDGGALPVLTGPVKWGIGSALGNGRQWVPWIHYLDVAAMYRFGIENTNLAGVYNMAAPNAVTNKQLTRAIATHLHKPLWLPNVPAFALKLFLGEMSSAVLASDNVSVQKIQNEGFEFNFPDITEALKNLYP